MTSSFMRRLAVLRTVAAIMLIPGAAAAAVADANREAGGQPAIASRLG